MSQPSVPSRVQVVTACEISGPMASGIPYSDDIWIKYGTGVTKAEAIIQQYVHENADLSIVRTPKVYDYFTIPQKYALPITYIVMERVYGTPLVANESSDVLDEIATAVRHIWSLPLPPQTG